MTLSQLTQQARQGRLTWDQAKNAVELMFNGRESQSEIVNFLQVTASRPIQADELAGYIQAIEHSSTMLIFASELQLPLLDIAAPISEGRTRVNISTLASLICAATDQLIVTNYRNHSISPTMDETLLHDQLGIPCPLDHDQTMSQLQLHHFAPLFAPNIFPDTLHVSQPRTVFGSQPTLFNLALPIARPLTGGLNILMGVANPQYLELFSQIYAIAPGVNRVLLVNSAEGSDELSMSGSGRTNYYLIQDNQVHPGTLNIAQVGLTPTHPSFLILTDPSQNIDWCKKILDPHYIPLKSEVPQLEALRDFVIFNAAVGLFITMDTSYNLEASLPKYINLARKTLLSGQALSKLTSLRPN